MPSRSVRSFNNFSSRKDKRLKTYSSDAGDRLAVGT